MNNGGNCPRLLSTKHKIENRCALFFYSGPATGPVVWSLVKRLNLCLIPFDIDR